MLPWAFGIYEFQLPHMDRGLAEMCEEFGEVYGKQFFSKKPQLMQVIPVEKEIPNKQQALAYEQVSTIIENSPSFAVFDCVCKKEKHLLGEPCDKPLEICTAYAPIPGIFDGYEHYRVMTKEEAYALFDKAEEAGLVHLTWNVQGGHFFICICCGCCCGVFLIVVACSTTGTSPRMSVEEARDVVLSMQNVLLEPPPRKMDDILALLDSSRYAGQDHMAELLRQADTPAPLNVSRSDVDVDFSSR